MNLKSFLKLDNIYGTKLVQILYYASIIVAVGSFFYSVISAIVTMTHGAGHILSGLWQFVTSPIMLVFWLIVIRVVCELLTVLFKHFNRD